MTMDYTDEQRPKDFFNSNAGTISNAVIDRPDAAQSKWIQLAKKDQYNIDLEYKKAKQKKLTT